MLFTCQTFDTNILIVTIGQLIPATGCDPRQRPWLSVTGVATNINSKDATFDIDAFQYTHGVAEATKDNRKAGVLPIRAIIPDSARYKTKKPIPSQNSYVAVVGFLSRFDLAENGYPDRFHIDVENVTFLGKSVLPARPANTPGKCDFHHSMFPQLMTDTGSKFTVKTPTPGSKKSGRLRFNFDDVFNDAPPSSSPLATPSRNDQPESENTQADETFATSDGPALEYADPSPNGNATLIPLKRQLESTVTPLSNTTNKRVARRG